MSVKSAFILTQVISSLGRIQRKSAGGVECLLSACLSLSPVIAASFPKASPMGSRTLQMAWLENGRCTVFNGKAANTYVVCPEVPVGPQHLFFP